MKQVIFNAKLVLFLFCLLGLGYSKGNSQFFMAIKNESGLGSPGAELGFRIKKFDIFYGMNFTRFRNSGDFSFYTEYNNGSITYKDMEISGTANLRATFLSPLLGGRYKFGEKKLKPYVGFSVFKFAPIVRLNGNGTISYFDSTGDITDKDVFEIIDGEIFITDYNYNDTTNGSESTDVTEDFNEELKHLMKYISPWGLGLAFGAEYEISENFSIFGDIIANFLFTSAKYDRKWIGDDNGNTLIESGLGLGNNLSLTIDNKYGFQNLKANYGIKFYF